MYRNPLVRRVVTAEVWPVTDDFVAEIGDAVARVLGIVGGDIDIHHLCAKLGKRAQRSCAIIGQEIALGEYRDGLAWANLAKLKICTE